MTNTGIREFGFKADCVKHKGIFPTYSLLVGDVSIWFSVGFELIVLIASIDPALFHDLLKRKVHNYNQWFTNCHYNINIVKFIIFWGCKICLNYWECSVSNQLEMGVHKCLKITFHNCLVPLLILLGTIKSLTMSALILFDCFLTLCNQQHKTGFENIIYITFTKKCIRP